MYSRPSSDYPTQKPGLCLNRKTPQCDIPLSKRAKECASCQSKHLADTLNLTPTRLTLHHINHMGPREMVQYIYNKKLWKRYPNYSPRDYNPLSKGKSSIRTKSFDDLSMGQIYYIFERLLSEAENNTRKQMQTLGQSDDNIDAHIQYLRDQRFKHNSERKKDGHGAYITDEDGNKIPNDLKDLMEETIRYNIDQKKFTFNHHLGGLENTVFDEYVNQRTLDHVRTKFAHFLHIPELTKKKSDHKSLSDQIAAIIDGKHPRPTSLEQTEENKTLLNDYFDKVYEIEGFAKSDKFLGDGVVKEALNTICDNMISHHDVDATDIIRVDSKNTVRATEKTITKNNFDLRKLTDMSRGTIACRSVKDMVDKMEKLHGSVNQYNKQLANNSSMPSVTDTGLISKIGPITGLGPLPSGYRDAKYHIKFSNGAVVEMQFQVDVLYEGKTQGFDTLNGLTNAEVITKSEFSDIEKDTIHTAISDYGIDLGGYDFFDLPSDYKLPGDAVYSIYRSLPGFSAKGTKNPTIAKLQMLEREIHTEGWLRNMKTIMKNEQSKKHNHRDTKLRNKTCKT